MAQIDHINRLLYCTKVLPAHVGAVGKSILDTFDVPVHHYRCRRLQGPNQAFHRDVLQSRNNITLYERSFLPISTQILQKS